MIFRMEKYLKAKDPIPFGRLVRVVASAYFSLAPLHSGCSPSYDSLPAGIREAALSPREKIDSFSVVKLPEGLVFRITSSGQEWRVPVAHQNAVEADIRIAKSLVPSIAGATEVGHVTDNPRWLFFVSDGKLTRVDLFFTNAVEFDARESNRNPNFWKSAKQFMEPQYLYTIDEIRSNGILLSGGLAFAPWEGIRFSGEKTFEPVSARSFPVSKPD